MAQPEPDLFDRHEVQDLPDPGRPLADRMRPQQIADIQGQTHLLAEGKPLRQAIESGHLHSMIFWGPPGTGKTSLAQVIANQCRASFQSLSAVLAGVKEIRQAVDEAQKRRQAEGRPTVLFIDEVHRFNKAQQDALLPHVENGTFILIGATTENPSFELNNALLSRARVYRLQGLDVQAISDILAHALTAERGLRRQQLALDAASLRLIAEAADGDARRALNLLEILADLSQNGTLSPELLAEVMQGQPRRFDKGGEAFYDQISALHKSVRGSAPDAALYWLCRMLDGGCEPLYIARRLVRMASEDIGNADPRALQLCLNAWDAQERLGSPEGELAMAQAVLYLACAPKSNAVYMAYKAAMSDASRFGSLEVPIHLRNAPTRLMKELGYGKAYRYAHDEPGAYAAGEDYVPEAMPKVSYYRPTDRGLEQKIGEKLDRLRALDAEARRLATKP